MRAFIFFLLPLLGSCRDLARSEVLDLNRDTFDGAVSVCYTYVTTYLVTVPHSAGVPSEFFYTLLRTLLTLYQV